MKRGLVSYVKSVDLGDALIVGRSRIHQSKSSCYLGSWENACNLYIRMLEFTFPGEDAIDKVVVKKGVGGIYKNAR